MTYLTIGQVNIPITWIALFIAVFYSDFRMRDKASETTKLMEYLLYLYLIIWKLSYVVFSASDFVQAPLSLLYFDGGIRGHFLAIGAVVMILYKKRQVFVWEESWLYWARLVTIFQLIYYAFQEQWLVVSLWAILLVLIERNKSERVLLGQLFLLIWLDGFSSSFTILQLVVIGSVYAKKKQAQILGVAGVLILVAMMLGDIESKIEPTTREVIDLPTMTGEHYHLTEQQQSLTIVNFFATWCPPCKAEMPHLQSFAENVPEDVALIGINLTARDKGTEALVNFIDTYDVTYPILLDETDDTGSAFQVLSIPTTVFLNEHGEELERIVGPVNEEQLRKLTEKYQSLLEE